MRVVDVDRSGHVRLAETARGIGLVIRRDVDIRRVAIRGVRIEQHRLQESRLIGLLGARAVHYFELHVCQRLRSRGKPQGAVGIDDHRFIARAAGPEHRLNRLRQALQGGILLDGHNLRTADVHVRPGGIDRSRLEANHVPDSQISHLAIGVK